MAAPKQSSPDLALGDPDFNPAVEAEDPDLCPQCQAKLVDPHGLGWCKKCGYCKSLAEDKARVPLENKPKTKSAPSLLGLREFGQMMAILPSWGWVLIGGVLTAVAINVPPAGSLPPDSLQRAAWSTVQIVLGIFMIVGAQTWALCLLAASEEKLGFKDAILPGRLWALVVRRLPETRGQLWLASWGLTCILSGIFIVGGLSHWLTYLPKKPPPVVEKIDE